MWVYKLCVVLSFFWKLKLVFTLHSYVNCFWKINQKPTIKSYLSKPLWWSMHHGNVCSFFPVVLLGLWQHLGEWQLRIVHYFILCYFYGFTIFCSHWVQWLSHLLAHNIILIVRIYLVPGGSFSFPPMVNFLFAFSITSRSPYIHLLKRHYHGEQSI